MIESKTEKLEAIMKFMDALTDSIEHANSKEELEEIKSKYSELRAMANDILDR